MGYNLSKIRREWRNLNPNVRKGQWTKEEDKVRLFFDLKKRINFSL